MKHWLFFITLFANCYILWRLTGIKTKNVGTFESAQYGMEITYFRCQNLRDWFCLNGESRK